MIKYLPAIFGIVGLALIGWAEFNYSSSGQEIAEYELSGQSGTTNPLELDPATNPFRLTLIIKYAVNVRLQTTRAFQYDFRLIGPGGQPAMTAEGQHTEKLSDKAEGYKSVNLTKEIKTFEINAPGQYVLDWKIKPEEAIISQQLVVFRENTSPLNYVQIIAGFVLALLGAMMFVMLRRKSRKG